MRLINLNQYTDNNSDENILSALTKSTDEELINYVSNVTSDLLNSVFLTDDFKVNAKENINNFDEKKIGEICTYMAITPYIQAALIKINSNNWQDKATAFLEIYIGYIIKSIEVEEFINNLKEMKTLLNISDSFYNGLLSFFGNHNETIKTNILKNLHF